MRDLNYPNDAIANVIKTLSVIALGAGILWAWTGSWWGAVLIVASIAIFWRA